MAVRITFALLLCALQIRALSTPDSANVPNRIWTSTAGQYSTKNVLTNYSYSDDYPIGNGRLGALIPGAVTDYITLNDDTFWSGNLLQRVNPDARETVQTMQQLVLDGNSFDAQDIADYGYQGTPVSTRHYEPLGYATLEQQINGSSNQYLTAQYDTTDYERWLDLENGTANVYFKDGMGTAFQREYLASTQADVIAIRLSADRTDSISFRLHLDRGKDVNRWQDYSKKHGNDMISIGGSSASNKPITYAIGAKVSADGGRVSTLGDYVICTNVTAATIFLKSWTTYSKGNPGESVLNDLKGLAHNDYDSIRRGHLDDYRSLAARSSVNLGRSSAEQRNKTTPERVENMSTADFDPELASLYFNFGRYLLIASSRKGSSPAGLQGIWNDYLDPNWGAKYTLNINLEMNYWPSLTTGLADLQLPVHDLLKRMLPHGTKVARDMYNSSGMCAHSNTDIWGDSAPQDSYISATTWPFGAAWLATHIFEHYKFTGDTDELSRMYDVVRAVAEFGLDFLSPYKGYMVTNPSLSPENTFYEPSSGQEVAVTAGPTVDNSIMRQIFDNILEMHDILGIKDDAFDQDVRTMRSKLPPLRLNQFGGIAEWMEDYKEANPGNGHMSNLWPAYPGVEITSANATTFQAARVSLNSRLSHGGGQCGWPRAWTMNLAARLVLPDIVHERLARQIGECTWADTLFNQGFPAPLQVDGNFGTTAGVVEALLQSHETWTQNANAVNTTSGNWTSAKTNSSRPLPLIRILPALPSQWAANDGGSFVGLRARGGFTVDASWDSNGDLLQGNVTSLLGNKAYVTLGGSPVTSNNGTAITVGGKSGLILPLSGSKGTVFEVRRSGK